MPLRTTSKTVTFQRPFLIGGFDQPQAAGTYRVDTEEEQIDAVSHPAWKRIATVIELKKADAIEYQHIDPDELQDALVRDGQPEGSSAATLPSGESNRARAARLVRRKKF